MKKIVLFIFFLLQCLTAGSQHRIGDFMAYGNNQGLPAALYYAVYQSSDGYLWIGSSSGLVRFDGKRYEVFFSAYADTNSLSDNIIIDIVEDDQQNLWFAGFYQGLTKYNLRTGTMQRYSRLSNDQTPGYGINKLLVDDDGLWVATAGRGLAHYIPGQDSFEFFIPDPLKPFDGSERLSNHVTDIAIDKTDADVFWLSTFDGLYSFHKKQGAFVRYVYLNPQDTSVPLPFLAIESSHHDEIYLGSWIHGLMRFNKISKQFSSFPFQHATPPNSIHYQVIDIQHKDDSTLYLASRNHGLLSFHTRTHQIHALLTNEMLPGGSSDIDIQHISITPDAGIFAGGNYYIYQQHQSFNRFAKSLQLANKPGIGVQKITYDQVRNGYWFGAVNAGHVIFLDKEFLNGRYYTNQHQENFQCLDLAIDAKQRVWAIDAVDGLLQLHEPSNTFVKNWNGNKSFLPIVKKARTIESDIDGNLWLATSNQLFFIETDTDRIQEYILPTKETGYFNDIILVAGQHNDVWLATDKGLFHCIKGNIRPRHIVPDDKKRNGIANLSIKSMTVDDAGNAWLGFESDGAQVVSFRDHTITSTYNLDDGLPGMQINYMATDAAGGIWVGTSAGLALYDPGSDAPIWQLFNREDGIKRDYIDRAIMTTSDGKLFFNIDGGVSWIDLKKEESKMNYKLQLHLTSVTIDGQSYLDSLLPDYLSSVNLSYASKEIRFEFAAMDWLHPSRTKYFYRIDGINPQDEWIENKEASILLTGIKPGKYMIQLYAINGNGIKSNEINLPVSISPPFWQRWWFISLVVMSVFGLGYLIYRYRIRQLKKYHAMRNTISTNLHDDIGASLSNIHILTVLTQRNISNKETASNYITKAGEEIQRISEALSDIVWNISPRYDDLDNLFVRMKRYAADMFDGKNIAATLVFPEHGNKISMPMDQRRDFYLIFKEGVNNLVKYAGATEGVVKVTIDHKTIHLQITDNGSGFNLETVHSGNGMQNMKQRAAKWGSALHIKSVPGKGTHILLDMVIQ